MAMTLIGALPWRRLPEGFGEGYIRSVCIHYIGE